jgi:hypothetical protein
MRDGHLLSLSKAEIDGLVVRLQDAPSRPPNQWVEMGRRAVHQ